MQRLTLTLEDSDKSGERIGSSIRFDVKTLEKIRFDNLPDVLDKLRDDINQKKNPECLHKQCIKCKGTGRDYNGHECVHFLVCKCKNCSTI